MYTTEFIGCNGEGIFSKCLKYIRCSLTAITFFTVEAADVY